MPSGTPSIDAPGLELRRRADGSYRLLWRAPKGIVRAGYERASVRLDYDIHAPEDHPLIIQACRNEQAAAEAWYGAKADRRASDGTLGALCRLYQTHEASSFHGVKHNTRRLYVYELRTIEAAWGARRIDALAAIDFRRWFTQAIDSVEGEGGGRKAHGLMKRIRALMSFGVMAEVPGCDRLHRILGEMEFAQPRRRKALLTYAQARAIIAAAHVAGRPSIALAQALQFETGLRQVDVIGLWEPCAEDDRSPYRTGRTRWAPGLVWQDIDRDMVLTVDTSKTGAVVTHALASMPLVMAEIDRVPRESRIGPMIVNENTGRPWLSLVFSRNWREIADAAGVPRDIWNRDSRAGALSEGDEAGADLADLQRMAGHTSSKMTSRYVRGRAIGPSIEVANLRTAKRERKDP
jgi:integrase